MQQPKRHNRPPLRPLPSSNKRPPRAVPPKLPPQRHGQR